MAESLNVIALISGGKDSFFSLLHCLYNGHKVVALGNLYPAVVPPHPDSKEASNHGDELDDEHDLNSFMYQTVGHTVIPLYGKALGIPLYRQQIVGTAIQTGTSYGHTEAQYAGKSELDSGSLGIPQCPTDQEEDETESLMPLLRRIMQEHPEANALSSGAILSTYQRTRLESVALRLGLIPLAYLWQYPVIQPDTQTSLLQAMNQCGLDARIVKVASGGLDESFLWENVAHSRVMRRIENSMRRFGTNGDGAVLGEGGEFETLVVDGPPPLFKSRIEISGDQRKIVREGGGSAWLRFLNAGLVEKEPPIQELQVKDRECFNLGLLEKTFSEVYHTIQLSGSNASDLRKGPPVSSGLCQSKLSSPKPGTKSIIYHTISAPRAGLEHDISVSTQQAADEIRLFLSQASLQASDIISTAIVLRSMSTFAQVNKVLYSTPPNLPTRS
jgi:diphthine-ammonia ligase